MSEAVHLASSWRARSRQTEAALCLCSQRLCFPHAANGQKHVLLFTRRFEVLADSCEVGRTNLVFDVYVWRKQRQVTFTKIRLKGTQIRFELISADLTLKLA